MRKRGNGESEKRGHGALGAHRMAPDPMRDAAQREVAEKRRQPGRGFEKGLRPTRRKRRYAS
jgi:hypothetical protein